MQSFVDILWLQLVEPHESTTQTVSVELAEVGSSKSIKVECKFTPMRTNAFEACRHRLAEQVLKVCMYACIENTMITRATVFVLTGECMVQRSPCALAAVKRRGRTFDIMRSSHSEPLGTIQNNGREAPSIGVQGVQSRGRMTRKNNLLHSAVLRGY